MEVLPTLLHIEIKHDILLKIINDKYEVKIVNYLWKKGYKPSANYIASSMEYNDDMYEFWMKQNLDSYREDILGDVFAYYICKYVEYITYYPRYKTEFKPVEDFIKREMTPRRDYIKLHKWIIHDERSDEQKKRIKEITTLFPHIADIIEGAFKIINPSWMSFNISDIPSPFSKKILYEKNTNLFPWKNVLEESILIKMYSFS